MIYDCLKVIVNIECCSESCTFSTWKFLALPSLEEIVMGSQTVWPVMDWTRSLPWKKMDVLFCKRIN